MLPTRQDQQIAVLWRELGDDVEDEQGLAFGIDARRGALEPGDQRIHDRAMLSGGSFQGEEAPLLSPPVAANQIGGDTEEPHPVRAAVSIERRRGLDRDPERFCDQILGERSTDPASEVREQRGSMIAVEATDDSAVGR